MKFAVIGSAHNHIKSFVKEMLDLEHEMIGVMDDKSDLAKSLSIQHNVPLYQDMESLFEMDLDIVGTAAVNNIKIDIIEKCLEKGIHVIADKPIVTNEAQYKRLEKAIDLNKAQVGMILSLRFEPVVSKLKELIDLGELGDLVSIEIFNPHKLSPEKRPDWHFEKASSGGVVVDLLVHSIDMYNWLTKSRIKDYSGFVTKSILPDKKEFFDSTQFMVLSENGTTGYFRSDWHMPSEHWNWGDVRIFCTGTKGCVEARITGDPISKEQKLILFSQKNITSEITLDKASITPVEDFINRIENKKHIVTHKEILEDVKTTIEFDKVAKKVNMFD